MLRAAENDLTRLIDRVFKVTLLVCGDFGINCTGWCLGTDYGSVRHRRAARVISADLIDEVLIETKAIQQRVRTAGRYPRTSGLVPFGKSNWRTGTIPDHTARRWNGMERDGTPHQYQRWHTS